MAGAAQQRSLSNASGHIDVGVGTVPGTDMAASTSMQAGWQVQQDKHNNNAV
jgi:hypothetical protein